MSELPNTRVKTLAVSLSGGGHRATLFALGALMYLVDAKANANVTSIASVSGGTLTNGMVGQALNFRNTNGIEFRERVAIPLASQIANKGTLFAPLLSKVYVAFLIVSGLVFLLIPASVEAPWYVRVLLLLAGLMVWGWIFAVRGRVCARAFKVTLFSPNGRTTKLSDVRKDGLDHVICATEFRSAEQVYFAGDFIYSYALGCGTPAELSLAKAVQASADFPGGFPPVNLPTKQHQFSGAPPESEGGPPSPPTTMVLTDGGVYDNMGDQWARGFLGRINRCPPLKTRTPPDQLVVVNGSARVPWSPFRRRLIPLIGEVMALLRVNNILYINTTNVRRQEIVRSFDPNDPTRTTGLQSMLVQITQSPFRVATSYQDSPAPVGDRAKAVLQFLGGGPSSKEWSEIANQNSTVATSLSKFGAEVTARLVYQGYVVTMCNLHVLFGSDFPLITEAARLRAVPRVDKVASAAN